MEIRAELLEVLARRALTEDAARPEALAALHARGARSAREHVADLVDPGSFVEYGRFATAAQERIRPLDDLLDRSVADGLVGGLATVDRERFGDRAGIAVLSYDYLVMAGTQGLRGHHKTDRLLQVVERLGLPTVFFAGGGGGRPSDTDYPLASALDVGSFALWGRLAGRVPRIAVVSGPCFAGNAVIAGCADLLVATASASIGMGGPAMIAGGGLGEVAAEEVGPIEVQAANGVVDVAVADEVEAVRVTRQLLSFFQGAVTDWESPDQDVLRDCVPEGERTAYDVLPVISTLADRGSVVQLQAEHAPELVTALVRIEGHPVGVIANQTLHLAGAITSAAAAKAARFLDLCQVWRFPVVSLVDTPGMMVGPDAERTGLVRHASRMVLAGSGLTVPLVGVVLRRGYGLGAQAMLGGSTHDPLLTLAWPGAHLGPMGLEGAVRLALRKELAAIADPQERERTVERAVAALREQVKALNAARLFEIDDVVDPAETRAILAAALAAARRA